MSGDAVSFEANALDLIESKPEGISEKELATKLDADGLKGALAKLSENGAVEKRTIGGVITWYPLFKDSIRKVLIVEDDTNINNLMKVSLGKGYEIAQAFDGNDAMAKLSSFKPDLVLLDLMLPGPDGLEICKRIKSDDAMRNMVVIIVSAADERRNRFVSLRYGADYYIKKPFEPKVLRSFANIFLRKKGKRFDPLVDLPDTERLSKEVEQAVNEEDFEVNNLRVSGLDEFRKAYGAEEANAVVRLVSQIIQDKVREWGAGKGAVGYLGNGEFVVCGGKNATSMVVGEVTAEFDRVVPFIYQAKEVVGAAKKGGEPQIDLSEIFGSTYDKGALKRVSLKAEVVPLDRVMKKRGEIQEKKPKSSMADYTLAELQEMLGSSSVDLTVRATPDGVSFSSAGKSKK